jgi:hypothetical protein
MKKTYIVEVTETRKKYVAVELDDEVPRNLGYEAESIAWDLAVGGDIDFDSWDCSADVDATVLGLSSVNVEELWESEELVDVEDFRYKESDRFDKSILKG